jgi:hypothetical protein
MKTKTGAQAARPNTKTCRCCGHTRPIDLMAKAGNGKRASICKRCDNDRRRELYWQCPEASRAKRRARYWRNVDRERARNREPARTARGRELNRAAVKRYQARHPERIAAQVAARSAIKRGDLKRPRTCEVLGCTNSHRLHAHHHRADRPFDVVHLCQNPHHEYVHHIGPLRLKASAGRKWARAPQRHEVNP